ncbi:MAG: replicative DNA helicase [bacterium]
MPDTTISSHAPPYSQEAEEAVLGAILLESTVLMDVVEIIRNSDFYRPQNRVIYEQLTKMWENQDPIDILTLQENLKEQKLLDKIGGLVYLDQLFDSVPASENAKYYAQIVKKLSLRREIANLGHELVNLADKSTDSAEQIMDMVGQKFIDLAEQESSKKYIKMSSLVDTISTDIRLRKNEKGYSGIETGFSSLDNKLGGFQKSDFIILAARPSVGKTALALNIAEYIASNGKKVLFFSLEMSAEQLALRLLTSISGVNSQLIRRGEISKSAMSRIDPALDKMDKMEIFINENPTITPLSIRAEARRLKFDPRIGIDLIIIDYIQLITSQTMRRNDNRVQEVSDISRGLKSLARELNVPVLALSQLSRESEKQSRIPRLSDLRESGALEQDADVVMFLHRDEEKDKISLDKKTFDMKLFIAKHRNGPTGILNMKFERARTRFHLETTEAEDVFTDEQHDPAGYDYDSSEDMADDL